jgi:Arc/MetJ family transcription regulator
MSIKRKSHNLDESLLNRARKVLGVDTETDAIHAALRAVLVGEEAMVALRSARGRKIFRKEFERDMSKELRQR